MVLLKAKPTFNFLVEASKKMPEGKKYLYLNNAPCHTRAFGAKNTHSKAAKLKKSFDPIWAPPSTPESNLVEFCFSDLKHRLKKKLAHQE